jgi:hypothetical protein
MQKPRITVRGFFVPIKFQFCHMYPKRGTMAKKKKVHDGKSHYDPSRDTIGKIYRDLHLKSPGPLIEVGDMSNAMIPDLITDINEAIAAGTKEFDGRPFYVMIHEKKDLQMKDALLRRIFKQLWRPYPEDDTTVFYHVPKDFETYFCWSLPHWTEMFNIIECGDAIFEHRLVEECKAWRRNDLEFFGFMKDDLGEKWMPNPHFKDIPLRRTKQY